MTLIISLIICLIVSFLFTFLAKKLNSSSVVGLIVGGIILGSPFVKRIILEPNTDFILMLGDFGFFTLMFIAGMEISWCLLYEERKEAAAVAFFAATIPFLLGVSISLALGFSTFTSLAIGISMAITAEATKARVLLELNKLNTRVGSLMMGAGIIDDILGLLLFALVSYFFTGNIATKEFTSTMIAISAFFLGILVHGLIGREKPLITYIEKLLLLFLVPFFFIGMGIHFNFQSLVVDPWLLIVIVIVAIVGKIAGSLAAKPFTGLSWKQLYLVGWGMNSRGAVELAIAYLALQAGLVNAHVYSSLVMMALTTTIIFPFIFRSMVKKDPQIMGGFSKCKHEIKKKH